MRRLLLLLVVGLVLVGCGGSATPETVAVDADTDAATRPAEAPAQGTDPGSDPPSAEPEAKAPFGTVTTVDGATLDGATYAGQSLALWFWAPW